MCTDHCIESTVCDEQRKRTYFENVNLGNWMKFLMYIVKFSALVSRAALWKKKKETMRIRSNSKHLTNKAVRCYKSRDNIHKKREVNNWGLLVRPVETKIYTNSSLPLGGVRKALGDPGGKATKRGAIRWKLGRVSSAVTHHHIMNINS